MHGAGLANCVVAGGQEYRGKNSSFDEWWQLRCCRKNAFRIDSVLTSKKTADCILSINASPIGHELTY
jgi:hypothetical protein